MDTDALAQIGLNPSEIKVYFALLELDSSTVGPIYERAGVADSKIYAILDKLRNKGLVNYIIKNKVKHYQASDPKNILQLISEKEIELSLQRKHIQEYLIPQIQLQRELRPNKQEAVVYESFDGLRAAFNLILDSAISQYSVFMSGAALGNKQVIRFFQNYHKKRIQKHIRVRLLSHYSHKKIIVKNHIYKGMVTRYTSQKLPVGTFIFDNTVMTVIWEPIPTAFVIKSDKNYTSYLDFFQDVWLQAKH